jgi:hypothetical protein
MTIDINVATQDSGTSKRVSMVLGVLGLILVVSLSALILTGLLSPSTGFVFTLLWFLPSSIDHLLKGLGRRPLLSAIAAQQASYLKINAERVEQSKGGWLAKPKVTAWQDVKKVDIKLFEIHLTKTDNDIRSIDLHALTDDNLKLVKDYINQIKSSRSL